MSHQLTPILLKLGVPGRREAAAAALRRDFPSAFADAFIETRLGRPWRATYGMVDGRFDSRTLLDYVAPAIG